MSLVNVVFLCWFLAEMHAADVYVRERKRGLDQKNITQPFMTRTHLRSQIKHMNDQSQSFCRIGQAAILLQCEQTYFSVFYAFVLKIHNLRKSSENYLCTLFVLQAK